MSGRDLHLPQGYAGVEGGRDRGMAKSVRADRLVDPGSTGNAPHDPARNMAVEAPPVRADEDGPGQALTNGKVDRPSRAWCQRHRHHLATFAQHGQRTVASLEPKGLDVGPDSFGDTKAVQGEQRDESVLGR